MAKWRYTNEHIEYLREIAPGRYNSEITKMFNKRFNTNRTECAIATIRAKNGIKSGAPNVKTKYTQKHINYIRELCSQNLFLTEITKKFNKQFGLNKTEAAISNQKVKHKIYTTARNYWDKGHEPWNKGKTGYMGANKTSFKKGNIPPNAVKVGTEIIDSYGYAKIKIAEPNVWAFKHRIIWEKHNGEVPDDHCIIFGDGNKQNLDIDNLICVSRAQLLKLNQFDLIKNDSDLTRVGINIANLRLKIGERGKDK